MSWVEFEGFEARIITFMAELFAFYEKVQS